MTIYFSNPGSFDIRLLSTFGVNAKPHTSSPIGFFGTGLKYAVAGVLRLSGTVTIASGPDTWTIGRNATNFRGKEVDMCQLHSEEGHTFLPFSTDLGKHWEPWMIYREFRCNATDEGGAGRPSRSWPAGQDVVFAITCPAVEEVLSSHQEYFIEGKPMATLGGIAEIHPGKTPWIYYKGVAVGKPSRPPMHKYNILFGLILTEDRTASDWSALSILATAYAQAEDRFLIHQAITAPKESFEHQVSFSYEYNRGEVFTEIALATAQTSRSALTDNMKAWASIYSPEARKISTRPLGSAQAIMLDQALALFPRHLSFSYPHQVLLASDPNPNLLGFAWEGVCYLTERAFQNIPELFSTLLEEHIHLSTKEEDLTRGFQEALHQVIRQLVFGTAPGHAPEGPTL